MGGSPPKFIDIRLVKGNKSDILVKGGSASVKHDMCFSISIISSQLGGGADVRVSIWSKTNSTGAVPPEAPPEVGLTSFLAAGALLGPAGALALEGPLSQASLEPFPDKLFWLEEGPYQ